MTSDKFSFSLTYIIDFDLVPLKVLHFITAKNSVPNCAIEPEIKQCKQSSHLSRPWGGIAFSPFIPARLASERVAGRWKGEKVYPVECVAYSSGAKERI